MPLTQAGDDGGGGIGLTATNEVDQTRGGDPLLRPERHEQHAHDEQRNSEPREEALDAHEAFERVYSAIQAADSSGKRSPDAWTRGRRPLSIKLGRQEVNRSHEGPSVQRLRAPPRLSRGERAVSFVWALLGCGSRFLGRSADRAPLPPTSDSVRAGPSRTADP